MILGKLDFDFAQILITFSKFLQIYPNLINFAQIQFLGNLATSSAAPTALLPHFSNDSPAANLMSRAPPTRDTRKGIKQV